MTGAASSKSGDGVVNVNGTAELKVNTALEMGALANLASPGAALTVSTINVNGGKLTTPGISAGLPARTALIAPAKSPAAAASKNLERAG